MRTTRLDLLEVATDHPGDLDPADWEDFRLSAHRLLDDMISDLENIRRVPVWQPPTVTAKDVFARPLPREGLGISRVVDDIMTHVAPYATGNRHPRFMGWVHGAGTPFGMLAEMIAGTLNINCGGRDHIGLVVERQIASWMAEALGYPQDACGLFVTGSSMANFLAVVIAKTAVLGRNTRLRGLRSAEHQLVAYTSQEAHGCIAQAMELAGIGSSNLRRVMTTPAGGLDVNHLCDLIAQDQDLGLLPFLAVGTAGTVNTGALDPLIDIAAVAKENGLWFHVDAAIGAVAAFSETLAPRLAGIERSDSIAMDFHKWAHVPYDAGFLLVRDRAIQEATFRSSLAYLQRTEYGLAGGSPWPCDHGPDLSRGFRALKTWVTISAIGARRLGDSMDGNCALARRLADLVASDELFELKAPVALNIVCLGLRGNDMGPLNREIVVRAQLSGEAAPSLTTVSGEPVIRCAIFNHRTTGDDVHAVMKCLRSEALKVLSDHTVAV